jgi:hypothetical protein
MADSSSDVVPFYSQLSRVFCSLPCARWLQAALHLTRAPFGGPDVDFSNYLKFLHGFTSPPVPNVSLFFADTFKPLVLELFGLFFSANDINVSALLGDVLCYLMQGASAAVAKTKNSIMQTFFVGSDPLTDQNTLNLLKQLGFWRRNSKLAPFQFSPSHEVEYQSQHPYTQDDCLHIISFPSDVKHVLISFDSRSQTCPNDTLEFSSHASEACLRFSGNNFSKSQIVGCKRASSDMALAGNEIQASFDCSDSHFSSSASLWGYKFTAFGFSVEPSIRKSIEAVQCHLDALFQDLLLLVCSQDDRFAVPPELLDSDEFVGEAAAVFADHLSDIKVRQLFEDIFSQEFSASKRPSQFLNFFQRTIIVARNTAASLSVSVCGKCSLGHLCQISNGLPVEPKYSSGWSCNICGMSMALDQANVWHCSICAYDVCPWCQPGLTENQSSDFAIGDMVHLVPPEIADFRMFSDAASGPMKLGLDYAILDITGGSCSHVNIEGQGLRPRTYHYTLSYAAFY